MGYSLDMERADNQYLFDNTTITFETIVGDFSWEMWWRPESLVDGEDQLFMQTEHTLGGNPIRIWFSQAAGTPFLNLQIQEVGGAAPAVDEFCIVQWDITGLVSAATWVHLAILVDISQAVASIAELMVDGASQGVPDTVVAGTDCSSIAAANNGAKLLGDGTDDMDGRAFNIRIWDDLRTTTEITDNYVITFADNANGQANLIGSYLQGGQSLISSARAGITNPDMTLQNGTLTWVADLPPAFTTMERGEVPGFLIAIGNTGQTFTGNGTNDSSGFEVPDLMGLQSSGTASNESDHEVLPLGGGKDLEPPTIENVSPTPGQPLATTYEVARLTPVEFDVIDPAPGLRLVLITLKYLERVDTVVVFNGSDFVFPFNSAQSTRQAIVNGFHFQILPVTGWESTLEELFVYALDSDGNLEGSLP